MKKTVLGLLAATVVLAMSYYFATKSSPDYDTHPRRSFKAQDAASEGFINRAFFSNDCTLLLTMVQAVSGTQPGKFVIVWDLEKEKQLCKISPQLLGFQMALSPDDQYFAMNGDGGKMGPQLLIHETATGKRICQLPLALDSGAWDIEFLPDGKTLLILEGFSPNVSAKVWNWKEEKEISSFPSRGLEMAISADGRRIVTGGIITKPIAGGVAMYGMGAGGFGMGGGAQPQNRNDDKARLYDVQTGKMLHELPGHKEGAIRFAFSPDSAFVATGGMTPIVRIWNTDTGGLIKTLDPYPGEDRRIRSITYSQDGTRLAVSYSNRKQQTPTGFIGKLIYKLRELLSPSGAAIDIISPTVLWDCSTWEPIHVYGLNQAVTFPAFLPDNQGLVTIDLYGNVRWWNLP